LDGITLYAIRSEMAGYLPLRIQKVMQPKPKELVFQVWNASLRDRLVLSLEANRPFFGFSDERQANPPVPPGFCLGLRKRLEGATLNSIGQHRLDRVLYLEFLGRDDLGNQVPYVLVMDLAGRGQNIGLYKEGLLEAAAVPPVSERFVHGRPYSPPEGQRLDLTSAGSREDIVRFLETAQTRLGSGRPASSLEVLRSAVEGMGKDLAVSTLVTCGVDPDLPLDERSLRDLAGALMEVSERLRASAYSPAVYTGARGLKVFHVLPLVQYPIHEEFRSVLDGLRALRRWESRSSAESSARAYVQALHRKVQKKLESRHEAQIQDLVKAQDHMKYKVWARLIDLSGVRTPPGHSEARCLDYYRDPPVEIIVPLDPKYSARDNARNYWMKYSKLQRAQKVLEESLEALRVDLERMSQADEMLKRAEDIEALARVASMVEPLARKNGIGFRRPPALEGPLDETPKRGGRRTSSGPTRRPDIETIEGKNGAVYLVGGNARQNDYLIAKLRKPGDIWFHVKNAKGAHVLLRPSETVTEEDIVFGARLAALRSEARAASKVEVDWVEASRLRKPRGGPTGFVTYTGQKTIAVSLEP
jgi:predicted ribosome quality control (RQC) complex YloA/Tae2 family protein